jgi:hypothetical protein
VGQTVASEEEVTFQGHTLGVTFAWPPSTKMNGKITDGDGVKVESVALWSVAHLQIGSSKSCDVILISINGQGCAGQTYKELSEALETAARPLRLTFRLEPDDFARDDVSDKFVGVKSTSSIWRVGSNDSDSDMMVEFRLADFLQSRPPNFRPFMRELAKTQMFRSFLDNSVAYMSRDISDMDPHAQVSMEILELCTDAVDVDKKKRTKSKGSYWSKLTPTKLNKRRSLEGRRESRFSPQAIVFGPDSSESLPPPVVKKVKSPSRLGRKTLVKEKPPARPSLENKPENISVLLPFLSRKMDINLRRSATSPMTSGRQRSRKDRQGTFVGPGPINMGAAQLAFSRAELNISTPLSPSSAATSPCALGSSVDRPRSESADGTISMNQESDGGSSDSDGFVNDDDLFDETKMQKRPAVLPSFPLLDQGLLETWNIEGRAKRSSIPPASSETSPSSESEGLPSSPALLVRAQSGGNDRYSTSSPEGTTPISPGVSTGGRRKSTANLDITTSVHRPSNADAPDKAYHVHVFERKRERRHTISSGSAGSIDFGAATTASTALSSLPESPSTSSPPSHGHSASCFTPASAECSSPIAISPTMEEIIEKAQADGFWEDDDDDDDDDDDKSEPFLPMVDEKAEAVSHKKDMSVRDASTGKSFDLNDLVSQCTTFSEEAQEAQSKAYRASLPPGK